MSHCIMRPARISLVFAAIVVILLTASCGRGRDSGVTDPQPSVAEAAVVVVSPTLLPPTVTAVPPTATSAPTDTPLPEPTATPEPATATVAPPPTEPPPATAEPVSAAVTGPVPAPVRLVIPDLNMDVRVVPMGWRLVDTARGQLSEWVIPENEAGHHLNSAGLGQPGNLVISGHNNIYARVFENISRAWNDDARVQVDKATDRSDVLNGQPLQLFGADGTRYDYRIEEFYRLRDTGVSVEQRIENARFMQPTEDQRVTLITCWPPWNNTHRLVVVARPASAQP